MSTFGNANIGNYFVMHYSYSPKMTFMPTFWNVLLIGGAQ